jgi:hypothetical protein
VNGAVVVQVGQHLDVATLEAGGAGLLVGRGWPTKSRGRRGPRADIDRGTAGDGEATDHPVALGIEGDQRETGQRGLISQRAGVEVDPEDVQLGPARTAPQRQQQAGNDEETLHGLLPQLDQEARLMSVTIHRPLRSPSGPLNSLLCNVTT